MYSITIFLIKIFLKLSFSLSELTKNVTLGFNLKLKKIKTGKLYVKRKKHQLPKKKNIMKETDNKLNVKVQ